MKLVFSSLAWEDYLYWQQTDKQRLRRINQLIKDILRSPYQGIGKPEPLRLNYTGYWSRRIDKEHRLIYRVTEEQVQIVKCRYHYD
ncbi:MAG: Txe/YoeB family addiction module toxin [Bacteroidetes bacterium]|nr:Txe/YoeB family addiction module toxin [Bacteroidota bacterium]